MTLFDPANRQSLPALSELREAGDLAARAALYALERRYLDQFDWSRAHFKRLRQPLDWQLDARFVRLDQIGQPGTQSDARDLLRLGMQSLLGSMHRAAGSLVFALGSQGRAHTLLMGSTAPNTLRTLTGSLSGHLPGSQWSSLTPSEAYDGIAAPLNEWHHIGLLTGVPSFKLDDRQGQDLERLIEALAGHTYRLIVIADPLPGPAVDDLIERAQGLASELHPFAKSDLSLSRASGTSTSASRSEESNESVTDSTSTSSGSASQSVLTSAGTGLSMAVALLGMAAGLGPASVLLGELTNSGAAALTGRKSTNSGESSSQSTASGRGHSKSFSDSTSDTDTHGLNSEAINKRIQATEALLDKTIERLQQGRALGLWNVGVYLAAPDAETLAHGQAVLAALAAGKEKSGEAIRILTAPPAVPTLPGGQAALEMRKALTSLSNPVLDFDDRGVRHPLGTIYQSLGTPLNTAELSLWMNLPGREVSGLSVQPVVHFGLNPPEQPDSPQALVLGEVLSANGLTGRDVIIEADRLARHAFITGTTGSGKTNTTLQLLRQLTARGIPFLVIEPAKTEYRALLADPQIGPHLQIFTLGSEQVSPFRLNPFEFVPNFGLLTHIDLLKATFNAAFPMYASMPYLLEEAILDVYTLRGWDLATGQLTVPDSAGRESAYLPSLSDLYSQIDEVVERKQYAQQLRMDLSAALKARINSLRVGSKGLMLDVQRSIPIAELLARPTVLELQDLGDDSEKAFVMGLLLTLLYEYRQAQPTRSDSLQHLTIFEEAHRLLKRVGTTDNMEIANPQARAVETFGNMLAEVREYGEGIVVIDQIASKLSPDIIKNTNLKIVHRVMARDDRDEVGGAINLDEAQRGRLTTLKPGEAVIHSDDIDQAVLVRVEHARSQLPRGSAIRAAEVSEHMRSVHAHLRAYYEASWPAAPLIERAGCATCQARCRYGARVARSVNPKLLLPMLKRVENLKDSNGNVSLTELDGPLSDLARRIARPGDNAHDLKHCILTHYSDDQSVLDRHAVFGLE